MRRFLFSRLVVAALACWVFAAAHACAGQKAPDGGKRPVVDLAADPRAAAVAAYQQFLTQAEKALSEKGGADAARRALELCPKELRGFEWHYLHRQAYADGVLFRGHAGRVACVQFSPDRKTLASGSADQTVKLWDVASGAARHTLRGHEGAVLCLAFDAEGETLASGGVDGVIRLWDTATGKLRFSIADHGRPVSSLAFNPSGTLLASTGDGGQLMVHELPRAKKLLDANEEGFLTSVVFSPDGKRLVHAGASAPIVIRDAASFRVLGKLPQAEEVTALAFQADGQLLSLGFDGLRFWDVEARELVRAVSESPNRPIFNAATSARNQAMALAMVVPVVVKLAYPPFAKASHHVDRATTGRSFVGLHPNGHLLAIEGEENAIHILDLGQQTALVHVGEPVWAVEAGGRDLLVGTRRAAAEVALTAAGETTQAWLRGHGGVVRAICGQPKGKLIATAGGDGVLRLWMPGATEPARTIEAHDSLVRALAFSDDGKRLASAADKTVKVWSVAEGKELHTLRGHKRMVTSLAFIPRTRLLVSAGDDGVLRVWDIESGKETLSWKAHEDIVNHVAVSPDGKRLASAGLDRTIRIWDLDAKGPPALRRTIAAHTSMTQGVAFSPDGKRLASGGALGAGVTLWDAETGLRLMTFPRSAGLINTVGFSADGVTLFSGSYDGTVMFWKARPMD